MISPCHKIELKGEPYVKGDFFKQRIRARLASEEYRLEEIMAEQSNAAILKGLSESPLRDLNIKIKEGEDLGFDEAFLGTCYVLTATNPEIHRMLRPFIEEAHGYPQGGEGGVYEDDKALAMGTSFLEGMAFKESLRRLTPGEIGGMVAATLMDVVYRAPLGEVIDTCGMGGDRGFRVNGETRKTINVSTLSGIVLASLGKSAFKHGSYANTSAMGSTDAIEELGADINQETAEDILRVFNASGFHYSDAHLYKTIHDLSHLLKFETVNHIIGPMTTPVSADTRLHRVIGVNHKIHPGDVAQGYALIGERGFQNIGNVLVVSGLDERYEKIRDMSDLREIKDYMLLDELSPHASLVGIVRNGKYVGKTLVRPEDFGVKLDEDRIKLINDRGIIRDANIAAMTGRDVANADYLAMNAALGLFAVEYMDKEDALTGTFLNGDYLREVFQRCRTSIEDGDASKTLQNYVAESNSWQ